MKNGMPVYPGTKSPEFNNSATIDKNGYAEKKLIFTSHVGTHIDAPGHIMDGMETLDKLCIDKFFGRGCKIEIGALDGGKIGLPFLKSKKDLIEGSDFVLFCSGWSAHWGTEEYFKGFPVLCADAAEWLCSFPIKGIGYDAASADHVDSENLPIHKIILSHKKIIIENLTGLASIPESGFYFSCLPLPVEGADGSPVRAAAVLLNN
jgi:kynurenine formamidase